MERMRNIIFIFLLVGLWLVGCQKGSTVPVWTIEVPDSLKVPDLVYATGLPPGEPAAGDEQGNLFPPGSGDDLASPEFAEGSNPSSPAESPVVGQEKTVMNLVPGS